MTTILFDIVILAVVLGVLVLVHELGHYWAAKIFGVWVHRFSIGIGTPIKGLSFRRGETEYAISWLPIGGYVKMASREEEPASSVLEGHASAEVPPDRVFEAKPMWQRMVIILSGVTFNAVFAWAIFTGLAWKNGRHYDPTTTIGRVDVNLLPPEAAALASLPEGARVVAIDGKPISSWEDIATRLTTGNTNTITFTFANAPTLVIPLARDALVQRTKIATALEPHEPPVVGSVLPDYPAVAAGILAGDSITAVNGAPVDQWSDAVTMIRESAGKALTIALVRQGKPLVITVTPKGEHDVPEDPSSAIVGRIGAQGRSDYKTETLALGGAVKAGGSATTESAGMILRTLRGVADGKVSSKEVGGPILIGQLAAQQARAGLEDFLAFIALISINLAVVNMLPIPVLDGGTFVILVVEAVIRRPLPVRLREVVTMAGLAIVVLLMVVVVKNDIFRAFGK
ncbi:MAG TPA: RIP metalloprotease RseP [Gemmatimonadales bacterium]|jgi:regulator of sigma E protease|nr:RIP metalloprotease RseP [Gemmatimonadales bacterium]